jgi:hypothetical protein
VQPTSPIAGKRKTKINSGATARCVTRTTYGAVPDGKRAIAVVRRRRRPVGHNIGWGTPTRRPPNPGPILGPSLPTALRTGLDNLADRLGSNLSESMQAAMRW